MCNLDQPKINPSLSCSQYQKWRFRVPPSLFERPTGYYGATESHFVLLHNHDGHQGESTRKVPHVHTWIVQQLLMLHRAYFCNLEGLQGANTRKVPHAKLQKRFVKQQKHTYIFCNGDLQGADHARSLMPRNCRRWAVASLVHFPA